MENCDEKVFKSTSSVRCSIQGTLTEVEDPVQLISRIRVARFTKKKKIAYILWSPQRLLYAHRDSLGEINTVTALLHNGFTRF